MISRATLTISALGCITVMPLLILPIMIGGMVDEWGLSEELAGWSASLNFFGGAIAALLLATRIHHVSLRQVATLGMLATAVLDAASALTVHNQTLFLCVRFSAGVGAGAAYAAVMAHIARTSNPDSGYGIFMSLQFLISGGALYGLPWILPEIGVAGVYLLLAGLDLLAALLSQQLSAEKVSREMHESNLVELNILLRRGAILAVAGLGLYELANTAQFTYGERIGVALAISATDIGWIMGLGSILGAAGALLAALIGARWGRLLPLALGVTGTCLALSLFVIADDLFDYALASCLAGTAWAFSLPYFQAVEASLDPSGSVVAAGSFSATIGNAAGPGMGAIVLGMSNGYSSLLWGACAIAALSWLCMFLSARPASKPVARA